MTKSEKVIQNYLQNYLQRLCTRYRWVLIISIHCESKVKSGSFKRQMTEQYCCMFLMMCKTILKSLDWQKVSYQIIPVSPKKFTELNKRNLQLITSILDM